ncbi:hypothetical protein MHUMG1_03810 [Metarhizium humberi]|uniref:Uncharacterized protein n=1 Tax=Metarhizium humberi TaxID=2596975 RepID=A0A9P8MBR0_9HYPO|nr:hypothetical protein MHUMG1_03810 [Metarhizium humberi]
MDSEDQLSSQTLAQDNDCKDCMEFLDKMMSLIEKYFMDGCLRGPQHGRPFADLWTIKYEKVLKFTAELSTRLGLFGRLSEAEGEAKVGGVFVARPNAKKHLEKRNESKPDQPKTEDDAKKEADWIEAAFTMQAAQIYARDFALDQDIESTYGIQKRHFGQNLQRYIWIFLGQGSEEGLPWYNPEWSKRKATTSVHPDCTEFLYMWHNGLDIYEILKILGPRSESASRLTEALKKSKSTRDESLRP